MSDNKELTLDEKTALQEQILNDVIDDAKAKSAKLKSWHRSVNGKIVIKYKDRLPIYYANIFSAIDSLIHKYNLFSIYKFIYKTHPNRNKTHAIDEGTDMHDIKQEAIRSCDKIVLNNDRLLSVNFKHKIYQAIKKSNHEDSLSIDDFISIKSALIDHYGALHNYSYTNAEKKWLKRVMHFLEETSFIDINESY